MRVLVVGSGGREHALAGRSRPRPWSTRSTARQATPGSPKRRSASRSVRPHSGLVGFCRRERIDFVVVGPEAPLVLGLVDALEAEGIPAFGPSASAAALEGSKAFAKDFCLRARSRPPPIAISVTRPQPKHISQAMERRSSSRPTGSPPARVSRWRPIWGGAHTAQSTRPSFERRFGDAGLEIVRRGDCSWSGEEASFFALVDGKTALAARYRTGLQAGRRR